MNECLMIYTADGLVIELPFTCLAEGRQYLATQPYCTRELNITQVRLICAQFNRPIRFVLESFTLAEGEVGRWSITIDKVADGLGLPQGCLEYYTTESFGERVRHSQIFRWELQSEYGKLLYVAP